MSMLAGKPHLCVNDEILRDSRRNGNGNIDKDVLDNLCKVGQSVNPLDPNNTQRFPCRFKANLTGKAFLDAKVWDIEDAHHIVSRTKYFDQNYPSNFCREDPSKAVLTLFHRRLRRLRILYSLLISTSSIR